MTRALLTLSLVAVVGCKPPLCPEEEAKTFYADADQDGFGSMTQSVLTCDALKPEGFVTDHTDCDDLDASSFPGGVEACDQADNDCDGAVDGPNATGKLTFFADADGDLYGDPASPQEACEAPTGFVANDADCDDTTALASPEGTEVCDSKDNDCNGLFDDEPTDGDLWYADFDGDGFGTTAYSGKYCGTPEGFVKDTSDCDDQRADVFPGATEVCNGVDDNCDGSTDPKTSVGVGTWFADDDGDGYAADDAAAITQCIQPVGSVSVKGDCDDGDDRAHPHVDEACDGSDNDCDGIVDWGLRVPDDFEDLNDAIGAAVDGETICLSAGTFTGNFDTNGVSVTLQGTGSDTTILDGGAAGSVLTIKNGETVNLVGVTVQNGKANKGAAIYVAGSALDAEDVQIKDNEITPILSSTSIYSYGAVYLSGAEATFTDVDFTDHNIAPDFSSITLPTTNTSMYNYVYGSLLFSTGSVLDWDGGSITGNTIAPTHSGRGSYTSTSYAYSYTYGGLGYISGSLVYLSDLDVSSNTIAPKSSTTTTSTSSYNYAYAYGGLFLIQTSIVSGTDVELDSNTMAPVASGAAYGYAHAYGLLYGSSTQYTLDNVNFTDNALTPDIGTNLGYGYSYGLLYGSGNIRWDNSTWSDNTITGATSPGSYGYSYLFYNSGKFLSDGLTIDNNTMSLSNKSTSTSTSAPNGYCYGFYLYHSGYSVELDHLMMTNNSMDCAPTYTGTSTQYVYVYPLLWIYYGSGGSGDSLTNSVVANNTLTSAYYLYNYGIVSQHYYSTLAVSNVVISNNSASGKYFSTNYNGEQVYGAFGHYGYYDYLTMVNTSIDNNTITSTNTSLKTYAVGGYYPTSYGYSSVDISYSNFYENTDDAGVLYIGGSKSDPEGTDGNIAEDPGYADAANGDYTLDSASALIDAGDPAIEDTDTTTSDIGAYGGPGGDW